MPGPPDTYYKMSHDRIVGHDEPIDRMKKHGVLIDGEGVVDGGHSNTQADEVLFYVEGQFGSRKGVEACSISFHPGGIPHGPHPGTIVGSDKHDRTEEMAVMFDTDHPLTITKEAMSMDDPQYPLSWIDE